MKLVTIARILGNENPPRDTPGRRVEVLRHILETEPRSPEIGRLFILNRLVDSGYAQELTTILSSYRAPFAVVGFPWEIEPTPTNIARKGIAINEARNLAIKIGSKMARYTIVLDGDCGFTQEGLDPVLEEMRRDRYLYLSIPHRRDGQEKQGEPMLAFRNDAELRFDESLPFGHHDKLELLFRLGHDRTPFSGHLEIAGSLTKLVGEVLHYPTGSDSAESDNKYREQVRKKSLEELAHRVWVRQGEMNRV